MQTEQTPEPATQNSASKRLALEWRKRLLVHLRNKQRAAPASENVDRIGEETQESGEFRIVRPAPLAQRLVRADDLNAGAGIAKPVAGRAQNDAAIRLAHAHVPGRHQIQRQRIFAGIKPFWRLWTRTSHDPD